MKEVKFTQDIPLCPHCEVPTVRSKGVSSTTAMGWNIEYDELGNDISQDPNITTDTYYCHKCDGKYSVVTRFGKSEYR